jgi:hypothetical protein
MPCTEVGKWYGVGSGMCNVMAMGWLMQSVAMANPHEPREVGPHTLAVGFRIEPACEDVVNALDFFVTRTSDGKPISVSNGDVVDIEAEVQFRKEESVGSAIIQEHRLAKPEQAFGADNRYNAWFKPTIDGAYGSGSGGRSMISATRKPGHFFLMRYGYADPERKIPKAAGLPV